ncbi:Rep family protein [Streptococcus gordonii]|uniref:Rep family protein n=1 Tax=Streptococcus gordonii TaxID=1302 RepID=UPI0020019C1C|nr:Rep family protein [Streptococcus gordonii]
MAKKDRRSRLFFGMRNYKFETHDSDGNVTWDISEEDWREHVKTQLEGIVDPYPTELTYIFHDKDIDTDGEKKALHVHFVARFANAVSYDATIDKFGCEPRNFERARSETSALLYLTHTTPEAIKAKKRRYNVSELNVLVLDENDHRQTLRGDDLEDWYRVKIAGREGSNKVNTDDDVARIIDDLSEGLMTLDDVKSELKQLYDGTTATMTWIKNKRYFREAVTEYYQQKYYDWLEHGRTFQLVYIQGRSSIGKTSFAHELAKAYNERKGLRSTAIHNAPNDTKGARYDFLGSYENEAVTVFDDLKPNTFSYTEFLNLFDPSRVSKYSSRFVDKAWFAELGIITKSTEVNDWTSRLSYSELRSAGASDKPNVLYQPRRRVSLVVDISHDKVVISSYVLTDRKKMTHELQPIMTLDCPPRTDAEDSGFWDRKFQKQAIKAIMVALGLDTPTQKDLDRVSASADDETVNKAVALLAKMGQRSE